MMEAITLCQEIAGRELSWSYSESNRVGDHIWYISDIAKFRSHYPGWQQQYDLQGLLVDIHVKNVDRWLAVAGVKHAHVV